MTPNPNNYPVPEHDGPLADAWWKTREKRLALQKKVTELETQEKFYYNTIIDRLPLSKADGVTGRLVQVTIEKKQRVEVQDWDKFYAYIKRNNAFDLLNRAVNAKAAKDRFEHSRTHAVPGLELVDYKALSYSRRGA